DGDELEQSAERRGEQLAIVVDQRPIGRHAQPGQEADRPSEYASADGVRDDGSRRAEDGLDEAGDEKPRSGDGVDEGEEERVPGRLPEDGLRVALATRESEGRLVVRPRVEHRMDEVGAPTQGEDVGDAEGEGEREDEKGGPHSLAADAPGDGHGESGRRLEDRRSRPAGPQDTPASLRNA